jgi:hypothetical protein
MPKQAVYIQKTANHSIEFKLVELTTVREILIQEYKNIDKAFEDKTRQFNDISALECLVLLNKIREITFDLLDQVSEWQKMFVKAKRPTLLNCDYLVSMITSCEFLNSSRVRKHFNFALFRGNFFLLPLSTGKQKDVININPEMMREIEKFSNPDLDRLISGYRLFQGCVSKKLFKTILSMNRWAFSVWVPNVQVSHLPSIITSLPIPLSSARPRSANKIPSLKTNSPISNKKPPPRVASSPSPSIVSPSNQNAPSLLCTPTPNQKSSRSSTHDMRQSSNSSSKPLSPSLPTSLPTHSTPLLPSTQLATPDVVQAPNPNTASATAAPALHATPSESQKPVSYAGGMKTSTSKLRQWYLQNAAAEPLSVPP